MKKSIVLMVVLLAGLSFMSLPGKSERGENFQGAHLRVKMHDAAARNPETVNVDVNFGKIPLYFIMNRGQVDKKVLFYARTSNYVLWLTKEGLVFDRTFRRRSGAGSSPERVNSAEPMERDVSRFIFLNAASPEAVASEETKFRVNYFKGKDESGWYGDIPTARAVLYKNIYDHIDLKVYGIEKQVEYDWIVKPGGNPEDIRFEYENVKGTRLDGEGNLVVETESGRWIHKKPLVYSQPSDDGKSIARRTVVKFKKTGPNVYGFDVGDYDRQSELIIDPVVLPYSTYLGGNKWDEGFGIAVDSSGYTYVTGATWSTNFPVRDQYQADPGSEDFDAFVTKIDTDQNGNSSLVYSTYLGGGDSDGGYDIAVDNSGNVYVTGLTWSEDFPTRNPYQTYGGNGDVFITKIDTTRSGTPGLIYSTYLGGEVTDSGMGIAVDSKGKVYVTGWTYSTDFPTLNPFQAESDEDFTDGFVAKIDTARSGTSSLVYSTYLGGKASDGCEDIKVDGNNRAYVTGWTYSADFPTLNPFQTNRSGVDAFVSVINTAGSGASSLVYSTYLGGGDADYGEGIALDGNNDGYVYVTGITRSTNFPTQNPYQKDQGGQDAFVTMLDTTRSGSPGLLYSTYLGGNDIDSGYGIAVDSSSGYVYITGVTESSNFPLLNPYQAGQGNEDAFVSRLDTSRRGSSSLTFSTYLGGKNSDGGNDIAADSSGNVWVTGWTFSTDFPTANRYKSDPGDLDSDVFVSRFFFGPDEPPAIRLSRTVLDFSAAAGGVHTGSQVFSIANSGGGSLDWTVSASGTWIIVEPLSGTSDGLVTVSIDPTGVAAGTTTGTITVSDPDAVNSPQVVQVNLTVYNPGFTVPPFGDFSTPVGGSAVSASIPVTGWVLDDIGVESVKIYREEGKSLVYIGDAVFVEGARPDIEAAFPGYPMNYRAGWGYMMLTNFLPNGGNGTFTLDAVAADAEGHQVTLGTRTIIVNNIDAVKPFGAIDAPAQGGAASGSSFINWGWALTPQPNTIPIDGSTIDVWVDGINIGHPTYNIYRSDIAQLFPDYNNSSGAVGYFYLDTTAYTNGVHIIQWTAADNAGNTDGIGSRYFMIQNTGENSQQSLVNSHWSMEKMKPSSIPLDNSGPVRVKKGYDDGEPQTVYPDEDGFIIVEIKELERIEIHLADLWGSSHLTLNTKHVTLTPLPIGSTFDTETGTFSWQPGPGFVGSYRLVFAVKDQAGKGKRKNILINIIPRNR